MAGLLNRRMTGNDNDAERYDLAEAWCKNVVHAGHDMLFSIDNQVFPDEIRNFSMTIDFPIESLLSFLRNVHLRHLKRVGPIVKDTIIEQFQNYASGVSILQLAKRMNYSPYMTARMIVEHVFDLNDDNNNNNSRRKTIITEIMRDPMDKLGDGSAMMILPPNVRYSKGDETYREGGDAGVHVAVDSFSGILQTKQKTITTRLARETLEAMNADPLYGPRFDRERNIMGLEHELLLEQALQAMKIPFETEAQLRRRGTARTPDILLSCPVGIRVRKKHSVHRMKKVDEMEHSEKLVTTTDHNGEDEDDEKEEFVWKMVCWMDSKALFGDVHTHQTVVLPQAESYVHRFGPGLILYWFGHAPLDRLGDGNGDVVITAWNIPDSFMLPSGEIARHGVRPFMEGDMAFENDDQE